MSKENLSLENILLNFLNRILNPNFENKAIGAFLVSGFAFTYFSQPLQIQGTAQLDLGFLKISLSGGNDPNWLIFSIGIALIFYGGFALYKLKISSSVSKTKSINELYALIAQRKTNTKNAEIQQSFLEIFKVNAPVSVIEKLLSADDPVGRITDYGFASQLVHLSKQEFCSSSPNTNHQKTIIIFSWLYYIAGGLILTLLAAPALIGKKELTLITLPLIFVFSSIAIWALRSIRANSAAQRLLQSPPSETAESQRDRDTIYKLLCEIDTRKFDDFIYYGRQGFIYDDFLHHWEGINSKVSSSDFHIYEPNLKEIVTSFHHALRESLNSPHLFAPTNNGRLYKFSSHQSSELEATYEKFSQAIDNANASFRNLLTSVREKFADIDIRETNELALQDFRSYQLDDLSS